MAPLGTLAVQVDHVGEGPCVGILGQVPGAVEEDVVGAVVRAPGVQRVDGWQARLQPRGDALQGLFGRSGQRNAEVGRGVDQVRPLAAGVEDRG